MGTSSCFLRHGSGAALCVYLTRPEVTNSQARHSTGERDGDGGRGASRSRLLPTTSEAGGLLRTPTRTHNGARRTFRVDAHTDVRDSVRGGVLQTVVWACTVRRGDPGLYWVVFFRPFNVGRVGFLGDPPARCCRTRAVRLPGRVGLHRGVRRRVRGPHRLHLRPRRGRRSLHRPPR